MSCFVSARDLGTKPSLGVSATRWGRATQIRDLELRILLASEGSPVKDDLSRFGLLIDLKPYHSVKRPSSPQSRSKCRRSFSLAVASPVTCGERPPPIQRLQLPVYFCHQGEVLCG